VCVCGGGGVHTQDQSPQVGLQALELIGVILLLFLCDPPGVLVRRVHQALLVQPPPRGGLEGRRGGGKEGRRKQEKTDINHEQLTASSVEAELQGLGALPSWSRLWSRSRPARSEALGEP